MDISQMFLSKIGFIYSYSTTIIIVSLMFIISLRLFMNRRKKAYFSLMVSLAIIIFQYVLLIIYSMNNNTDIESIEYIAQILQVLAFILINMGIYQLYNSSRSIE